LSSGGSLPSSIQQVTVQTINYQSSTCNSVSNWQVQFCAGVFGGGKGYCYHLLFLLSLIDLSLFL
jgi:hypothetical protein